MTAIDTSNPSLTIIKQFSYRGNDEEWGNTYFFTGPEPSSDTEWKALADAVIADETAIYDSTVEVVRAIGHKAGDSVAVWGYDYASGSGAVPGTFTGGGTGDRCSGDVAVWVRWHTDQLTSRGKPIYLRNYFHGAYAVGTSATTRDQVHADQRTALEALGAAWNAGYTVDGTDRERTGPHGVTGGTVASSAYLTTRTLKRRGRRP